MSALSEIGLDCPHCHVGLPPDWTLSRAGRCPICRLVIGANRAATSDRTRDAHAGSAAGLLASAARRAGVPSGDPYMVVDALQTAATDGGLRVASLRMLDYEQFSRRHPAAPTLAVVLATFTTWKNARACAASHGRHAVSAIDSSTPDDAALAQATG